MEGFRTETVTSMTVSLDLCNEEVQLGAKAPGEVELYEHRAAALAVLAAEEVSGSVGKVQDQVVWDSATYLCRKCCLASLYCLLCHSE